MWQGDERLLPEIGGHTSTKPLRLLIVDDDTDRGAELLEVLRSLRPGLDAEVTVMPSFDPYGPCLEGVGVSLAAANLERHLAECAVTRETLVMPALEKLAAAMQIPQPIKWVEPDYLRLCDPQTKRRHYQRARKRSRRTFPQLVRRWSRW